MPLYSSISSIIFVKGDTTGSIIFSSFSLSLSARSLAKLILGSCLLVSFCILTVGTGGGVGTLFGLGGVVLFEATGFVGTIGGGRLGLTDFACSEEKKSKMTIS